MAEVTAFALTKMFSQLAGRPVSFKLLTKPSVAQSKPLFGVYSIMPGEQVLIVRSEMALIGSLGGALLGLPKESVLERIKDKTLDEVLRDAMHEVLNVAAAVVSVDQRAVFQNMYTDPIFLAEPAQNVLRAPVHTTQFDVTVDGYAGGGFAVLT